jgi:hypothetical protein
MLEKLLQAIAITLILSMLAGVGTSKPSENQRSLFRALSLPVLNLQLGVSSFGSLK